MFFGPACLGELGIDAKVSLPKPLTEALKTLPQIRGEAKAIARTADAQASRVVASAEAATITAQTAVVALVFGGIIAALLLREGRKKG